MLSFLMLSFVIVEGLRGHFPVLSFPSCGVVVRFLRRRAMEVSVQSCRQDPSRAGSQQGKGWQLHQTVLVNQPVSFRGLRGAVEGLGGLAPGRRALRNLCKFALVSRGPNRKAILNL